MTDQIPVDRVEVCPKCGQTALGRCRWGLCTRLVVGPKPGPVEAKVLRELGAIGWYDSGGD